MKARDVEKMYAKQKQRSEGSKIERERERELYPIISYRVGK
jgi:hypothetical protein